MSESYSMTYGFDLAYEVPDGWAENRSNADAIGLSRGDGVRTYVLLVLQSRPLSGSLADTYSVLWRDILLGMFTSDIKPLPMQLRLKSGYALAFDGGNMKMNTGESTFVVFYVIAAEDRAVPIIGVYNGWDESLEITMRNFFDTATIRGSSPAKAPLFTEAQMVGKWSLSCHAGPCQVNGTRVSEWMFVISTPSKGGRRGF